MPDKLTREQTIELFEEIHGDNYDYSKVDYQGNNTEVIIICREHGEFKQLPKTHKRGNGCQQCGNEKKNKSKKNNNAIKLILQFEEVHGKKYNYSKVDYQGNDTEVIIICREHGEFKQLPRTHKRGNGCQQCANKNRGIQKKQTASEKFIKESIEKHGDYYDYSKVDYQGAHTKVIIICPKHGQFKQSPSNHLQGYGCQKCGVFNSHQKANKTKEEYLNEAKEKLAENFNSFDYSKTEYVNCHTNIKIICKIHNIEFIQNPCSHLKNCIGCEECKKIKKQEIANKQKLSNEEFIIKSQKIHNNKYDYSKTNYINTYDKVIITCPKHGDFEMSPSNHIHKTKPQDCPKCKSVGYSKKQIQWLDFVSILNNITIQHAVNNKEHKIENIGKIDGYYEENNTVYEFHGDFFHGNPMIFNILDNNAINTLTKKSYSELYETTIKRDKKIKELGYNLVIMWEKQWDKINNSIKLLQNKWRDYKNKPHICEKCNISFKFKSQLEKHCKTELHKTGKKKTRSDKKEEFKCEICNLYTTNQQTNLKLHILNNHKTKEERKNEFPYYCELCDSGCMEEKLYKKHLETKKHKKKLELLSKKI